MRIISGKFKGHRLASFKENHIRPTMDRVKETLFNKWMWEVEEAKVLDLFSGTGSLGLEALSRGASHITFVEKNYKSIQIIKQNIQLLKIPQDQYQILNKDVISFLQTYKGDFYNLILIDPPFTEKMAHEVMQQLDSNTHLFNESTLIAIESIKQERIDKDYANLYCYDQLDYGDKFLSLFKKKGDDQACPK